MPPPPPPEDVDPTVSQHKKVGTLRRLISNFTFRKKEFTAVEPFQNVVDDDDVCVITNPLASSGALGGAPLLRALLVRLRLEEHGLAYSHLARHGIHTLEDIRKTPPDVFERIVPSLDVRQKLIVALDVTMNGSFIF